MQGSPLTTNKQLVITLTILFILLIPVLLELLIVRVEDTEIQTNRTINETIYQEINCQTHHPSAPYHEHIPSKRKDKFWEDFVFIIKTDHNSARQKAISGYSTWYSRVQNIVFVSDYDRSEEHVVIKEKRLEFTIPRMWDGVTNYAAFDDVSKAYTKSGWNKEFIKYLSSFSIAHDQYPDKAYYILIESDTYIFLEHLKSFLKSQNYYAQANLTTIYAGQCIYIDNFIPEHACNGVITPGTLFYVGGIMLSRGTVDLLRLSMESCIEKYKSCYSGDRRLGSCLADANASVCTATIPNREMADYFRADPWQIVIVEKVSPQQFLFLDWLETYSSTPGIVFDDFFADFRDFFPRLAPE